MGWLKTISVHTPSLLGHAACIKIIIHITEIAYSEWLYFVHNYCNLVTILVTELVFITETEIWDQHNHKNIIQAGIMSKNSLYQSLINLTCFKQKAQIFLITGPPTFSKKRLGFGFNKRYKGD